MNNKRKGILLLLLRDRSLYCANENCVIVNRKEFAMKKGKISKASVLFLGAFMIIGNANYTAAAEKVIPQKIAILQVTIMLFL